MGFRLANEVLDNAPDDLTPAERLVLSVLAGYVIDESTRECFPGLDNLVRRTGLKPDSLRKVFQRLDKRGLDPRVPIRLDKNGKKVFAHESQRTTYRIPKFESRDDSPATQSEEAGSASLHSKPRGGTVVPERRDAGPSEAGPPSRPEVVKEVEDLSSHVPRQPQPPSAAAPERETKAQKVIRGTGQLDRADEDAFIAWATRKFNIQHAGWWTSCADDVPGHIQTWLDQRAQPAAPKPAGERCTTCSTVAPVALTDRGKPYCAACTATCTSCHTAQPEDQLAHGECHPCRTARSSAA